MADRPTGMRAHRGEGHRERVLGALRFVRGHRDPFEETDGRGLVEQRFFDALALRDVLDVGDEIQRCTAFVTHQRDRQVDPHLVTVGVEIPLLQRVAGDLVQRAPCA